MAKHTFTEFENPYLVRNHYQVDMMWGHLEDWIKSQTDDVEGTAMAKLDLDPDFQRAHVWTEDQQRAYIEYKIKGGQDGGVLLFNCVGWGQRYEGPYVLVDGKQRIEAVRKFMRGELGVFGDLRFPKDFSQVRPPLHCSFRICINNFQTRADVLAWYLAVNTGGTPHTPEEIKRVKDLLSTEIWG